MGGVTSRNDENKNTWGVFPRWSDSIVAAPPRNGHRRLLWMHVPAIYVLASSEIAVSEPVVKQNNTDTESTATEVRITMGKE